MSHLKEGKRTLIVVGKTLLDLSEVCVESNEVQKTAGIYVGILSSGEREGGLVKEGGLSIERISVTLHG
jgi:hypothetical protein